LPRGVRLVHNEAQGGRILLAPERVFKADAIAAEIIKRCTGEVTFAELVDELAKSYAAPREKILTAVGTLLRGLADKRLLELYRSHEQKPLDRVPQCCISLSGSSPS
jgi:pyrroloquinoline quinone biosynthesis protein D